MLPIEYFVPYGPQLHEQPPPKRQRLEHPLSSAFSPFSSYCDSTSTPVRNWSAATHVGRSSSCYSFAQGTKDDRGTTSNASVSSASGNLWPTSRYIPGVPHRNNQGGDAARSFECSQVNQVSVSPESFASSANYSPGYGSCNSEKTYSSPVYGDNRSSGNILHSSYSRALQFAQAGSRTQVDTPTSNPVSLGDNNFLPSSSLNSNSIYGSLPKGKFGLPKNGGMVNTFGPCNPGSGFINGNDSVLFDGSGAGSNSDCNTWYSAPYAQNCGSIQGGSVCTDSAQYFSPFNFAKSQGSSKIVSDGFRNSNLPTASSPADAQAPCGTSCNAWFLFPCVPNFNYILNSAACTYPGSFFASLNVPCTQDSSQVASDEFNATEMTNPALSATAHVPAPGSKSSTGKRFYCSPREQNCSSVTGGALYTNPCVNFLTVNMAGTKCASQNPSTKLSNSDTQDSTVSAGMQDGASRNPDCNNQETSSQDYVDESTKHDVTEPATIPDSTMGVIPTSIVEVPSGDLQEGGDSVTTTSASDNNVTSEQAAADTAGTSLEIGSRLFPSGYATEANSLIFQASLDAAKRKQHKLKWPLPIPINIKVQKRNMPFNNIDYDYVTQCVYHTVQEEVCAWGFDKNGRLRVFVKSPRAASNLLQVEDLGGVAVQCSLAHGYTDTIGYIRRVPRRYTETALFELLQGEGIICAKRQAGYLRYDNGTVSSMLTGTVVLTFLPDRRLPQSVTIDHVSYEVIRRLKLPMQCFNCQQFGHRARDCVDPVSCRLCAGSHFYQDCFQKNKPRCANCRGSHASTFWKCPVRLAFISTDQRNVFVLNHAKDA